MKETAGVNCNNLAENDRFRNKDLPENEIIKIMENNKKLDRAIQDFAALDVVIKILDSDYRQELKP